MQNRGPGQPSKIFPDDMIRDVIREFLKGLYLSNTAANLNEEWAERGEVYRVRSDEINRIIRIAAARGWIVEALTPDEELASMVADRFGFRPSMIDVNLSNGSLLQVTRRAAEVLLDKVKKLDKEVVHVGFGAGRSTQLIAMYMARLMCSEGPLPTIVFHALTKGFHIRKVSYDPTSFFSYFTETEQKVEFVGLPTLPLVSIGEEADLSALGDVLGDPFAEKWDIDIIVTALANFADPTSEYRRLVDACGMAQEAEEKGVVGDLLYCPLGAEGKVEFERGKRVVTLFDLDELRTFAAEPNKHVVVVSGPCGGVERTRHVALRPLLEKDSLRVWTHIVTDRATCRNLLRI